MHELDRRLRDDSTSAITLAAAGLVGVLYGTIAAAITILALSAMGVVATFDLMQHTASNISKDFPNPVKALSHAVIAAIGVGAIASALIAVSAITAPIMIVVGAVGSRAHARENPRAGLLEKVFGSYTRLLDAIAATKNKFAELTNQNNRLEKQ